jgi:tRNA threonylcarbamoyladenosine biosynthesis protein TsaB
MLNMSEESFILALETSSRIGSVAIAIGDEILSENVFSGPMRHSSEIFPSIIGLLNYAGKKPRQIEHVYISGGPGSFTGLRIAVALAKTLHLANKTKIVQVDTLDVIASNLDDYKTDNINTEGQFERSGVFIEKFAVVLDAKRGQFYIAVYQHNNKDETAGDSSTFVKDYKKVLSDSLLSSSEFLSRFACDREPIWLLGDGLVYNKSKFMAEGVNFLGQKYWSPRANKVHKLGRMMARKSIFADPVNLTPFYLSKPNIVVKTR